MPNTASALEPIQGPAGFLAWEERQEERFEYVDGCVRAMVGAALAHNILIGNLAAALRPTFRGTPCRVFTEGVKLKVGSNIVYPDVMVSCAFTSLRQTVVDDALLVAEVLSPSSEKVDRERKLRLYTTLPGLRHYLLIAQEYQWVQVFSRQGGGWLYTSVTDPAAVVVLGDGAGDGVADVAMAALYEDTDVPTVEAIGQGPASRLDKPGASML